MVWLGVFLAIQTEDVFPQRHVEKSVCHPCQPLDIALQGSLRYWFNLKQVLGCQTSWLLFHWSFNGLYDALVQQSAKWDAYREKSAQHCLGYGNLETVRNNRCVCVYMCCGLDLWERLAWLHPKLSKTGVCLRAWSVCFCMFAPLPQKLMLRSLCEQSRCLVKEA